MSCTNCPDTPVPNQVYNLQYSYSTPCTSSGCPGGSLDSKCVIYTGANLTCSGVNTNDTVEVAIQKINTKLCTTIGDYSTYNYNCLTPVTTEAAFVAAITAHACTTRTSLTTFTGTTFPTYQTTVNNRFVAIEVPGITCSSASVTNTDTLQQVLNKYCTKFGSIDTKIDISGITWNTCYGTSTPTSIKDGFVAVLDQICQTKALITVSSLPTFNNIGSCLASPGATDSLVDTIGKIKTRLCLSPTFDINALTWSCITKPSSTTTDLQGAFQSVLTKIDILSAKIPNFSSDFTVNNVSDGQPCLGKTIALAQSLNVDRFVASNSGDTSPGTLADKLQAGTGMGLDYTTTPGKVILNAAPSSQGKVYANTVDDTLGFLDQKMQGKGSPDGILNLITVYNGATKKVDINPTIDTTVLLESLLYLLETDSVLKARFCAIVASCPSGCAAPQNPQATYIGESV